MRWRLILPACGAVNRRESTMFSLLGQVAVVTGAGAKVVVTDIDVLCSSTGNIPQATVDERTDAQWDRIVITSTTPGL